MPRENRVFNMYNTSSPNHHLAAVDPRERKRRRKQNSDEHVEYPAFLRRLSPREEISQR